MTSTLTVGERVAWYRRRRGISQEVLAGRVGRTADWLSKIENGRIELDRLSVLRLLADVLDVALADLIAEPSLLEWTEDSGQQTVPALRAVLMDYRQIAGLAAEATSDQPMSLDESRRNLDGAWRAYQDSRFGYVTQRLVSLIPQLKQMVEAYDGDDRRIAAGRLALAYHLAASTLTKLGEADLAWSASNRGIEAARLSENPVVIGSLLRSVAHSLLSTGAYAEAVKLTHDTAQFLAPSLPKAGRTMLSVYGTALLAGSMAAARAEDRDNAGSSSMRPSGPPTDSAATTTSCGPRSGPPTSRSIASRQPWSSETSRSRSTSGRTSTHPRCRQNVESVMLWKSPGPSAARTAETMPSRSCSMPSRAHRSKCVTTSSAATWSRRGSAHRGTSRASNLPDLRAASTLPEQPRG